MWNDEIAAELAPIVARIVGMTEQQLHDAIRARQEARRRRVIAGNRCYDAALDRITDVQQVVIDAMKRQGFTANTRLIQNMKTQNVCVTMHAPRWDGKRIATKLVSVYPDGTTRETFEKRITIRKEF